MNNISIKLHGLTVKKLNTYPIKYTGKVTVSNNKVTVTFLVKVTAYSNENVQLDEAYYYKNNIWVQYNFKQVTTINYIEKVFCNHIKEYGLLYTKKHNDHFIMVDKVVHKMAHDGNHKIKFNNYIFISNDYSSLWCNGYCRVVDIDTNAMRVFHGSELSYSDYIELNELFNKVRDRYYRVINRPRYNTFFNNKISNRYN